jgi:hypothetical protein
VATTTIPADPWVDSVRALLLATWGQQTCQRPEHWPDVLARLMKNGTGFQGSSGMTRGHMRDAVEEAVGALTAAFGSDQLPDDPARSLVRLPEARPSTLQATRRPAGRGTLPTGRALGRRLRGMSSFIVEEFGAVTKPGSVLRGWLVVMQPSGQRIHDCGLYCKDGRWWVSPPSKAQTQHSCHQTQSGSPTSWRLGPCARPGAPVCSQPVRSRSRPMHCRFAERPAVGGCGLSQLNSHRRVLPKPLILFTPMPEQADCSLIGTAPPARATLRLVTRMLGLGQQAAHRPRRHADAR